MNIKVLWFLQCLTLGMVIGDFWWFHELQQQISDIEHVMQVED